MVVPGRVGGHAVVFLIQQPQVIFVHIPKAGGSAITEAARGDADVVRYSGRADALPWGAGGRGQGGHATAAEIRAEVGADFWDGALTFATVRNPWTHRVSCWLELMKGEILRRQVLDIFGDFDGWIRWIGNEAPRWGDADIPLRHYYRHRSHIPQTAYLCDESGRLLVDHVLRFESLADDFRRVLALTGLPDRELRRTRVTGVGVQRTATGTVRPYPEWYTDETAAIVGEVYAADCAMFGYSRP